MRSFTFSSERIPGGRVLSSAVVGIALALLAMVASELFWRSRGHQPSLTDTPDTWSHYRAALDGAAGRNPVALLGSSRIHTDFDLPTFRAAFPDRPVFQLAIDGLWPMAVLENLSASGFSGTAIVDVTAQAFLDRFWPDQKSYVRHFQRVYSPSPDRKIETRLRIAAQTHIVVLQSALHIKRVAKALASTGALPVPSYLVTHADRQRTADYSLTDSAALKAERVAQLRDDLETWQVNVEMWSRNTRRVHDLVARIRANGGQVVFVALPVAPEIGELLEQKLPRSYFWDSLAATTGAPTLWLADEPDTAGFAIPDGSHVDISDSPALTTVLIGRLRDLDLL